MQILPTNNKSQINELRHLFICLFVYLFIGSILAQRASAQASRTLTVVSPTVELSLNPGEKAEGTVALINEGKDTLPISLSIYDFIVQSSRGEPSLLPPNTLSKRFSAASWIGVTPASFILKPGQRQTISYYVQVPPAARPGGHYAALIFKSQDAIEFQGSGASLETQMGALFYLTVKGPVKEQIKITRFFASNFWEYGPVKIQTQIENLGDSHIKPIATITIFDWLGRRIEMQALKEGNIFPTANREYQNPVGQKIMIGRFKAILSLIYGKSNNQVLTANLYFWVFPWKLILIFLTVLSVILIILLRFRKSGRANDLLASLRSRLRNLKILK